MDRYRSRFVRSIKINQKVYDSIKTFNADPSKIQNIRKKDLKNLKPDSYYCVVALHKYNYRVYQVDSLDFPTLTDVTFTTSIKYKLIECGTPDMIQNAIKKLD
jgi:hypothetical protein